MVFADQVKEAFLLLEFTAQGLKFGYIAQYRDQAFLDIFIVSEHAGRHYQMELAVVAVVYRDPGFVDFSLAIEDGVESIAIFGRR